jgi:SAM-dependent methyltransferase
MQKLGGNRPIPQANQIPVTPSSFDCGQVKCASVEKAMIVTYDENLLERSRSQWQFGDWESLAALGRDTLQHHPDRAKLALLAAAGLLQTGDTRSARQFVRLALDWGCGKKQVSQILIAGVHKSLSKAAALCGQNERASRHFENAIAAATPIASVQLISEASIYKQLAQLGQPAETEKWDRPLIYDSRNGSMSTSSAMQLSRLENERCVVGSQALIFDKKIVRANIVNESNIPSKYKNLSSTRYWEERYREGRNSGYGSYGRLSEFKAKIINKFIVDENVKRVIDFGCGDGNQLSMVNVAEYIGIDVSPFIVERCKERFHNDPSKVFLVKDEFLQNPFSAELTLSLDVIYHLVEDGVFEQYMNMLFDTSEKFCIIYSCDEDWIETDAVHVRRRRFTDWVTKNLPNWRLIQIVYNKYPHDGSINPKDRSFSNFYIYAKLSVNY